MKSVICVCLFAVSTLAFAQGSYPLGDDQVRSEMSASEVHSYQSNNRADFGITTGFAGFKIDDIAREWFSTILLLQQSANLQCIRPTSTNRTFMVQINFPNLAPVLTLPSAISGATFSTTFLTGKYGRMLPLE